MGIPDKLLINLRILGNVQKNGRIARSYDGIITIEGDNFYQPIRRFLSSDSRRQAIHEITSIMNDCITTTKNIIGSKSMNMELAHTEEFFKGCENLSIILKEMKGARVGIENLKFTYADDINIVSQIDVIILKFSNLIRDTAYKLSYFESVLNTETTDKKSYNKLGDNDVIIDIDNTDLQLTDIV